MNAELVARYQQWTREAVEANFAATLIAFEQFLKDLPETALVGQTARFMVNSQVSRGNVLPRAKSYLADARQ